MASTTTRQVVQVRHFGYDVATLQPHLGARIAVFDFEKLFIFNKMHKVAHELLYRYAHCEEILPSHANWGYTYEGGPIMAAWSPWHTLETLRRELDKVFDESGPGTAPAFRTAFLPGRAARRYPLMNLYEDQEAVYLEALAPGVDPATLDLSVVGNTLSLTGEKRRVAGDVKPEAFHRSERATGTFVRHMQLPVEVDENNVHADYKDGLLMVTLPKTAKAKPKQIAVQVG